MKNSNGDTKRVAVLVPSGATSNWRKLEGIMAFARTCPGWEVAVITSERLATIKRELRSFRPNGLICGHLDETSMAHISSLSLPTVIAFAPNETLTKPTNAKYVMSDGVKIGRIIARHVYSRGYRIFLCVGKLGRPWESERFDAFEKELARFNCPVSRLDAPYSQASLLERLKNLPPRSAVFAADDNVGVAVLDLARRNGLDVPRNFGVIGVSNLTIQCENSHPPLTSLDQNFTHGGYLAAQRLKTLLSGGIVPDFSYYQPGSVQERESLPAIDAMHSLPVDLAMACIARNKNRPIEVPDVVVASGVSRRTLENLFQKELSSSIAETIRNVRLDHLAAQLRGSNAPISQICDECGWAHPSHAMRLFKIRFGITMATFRQNKE
jgi:LacI family transcriptional regulator